jgi:hypothetical protein
MCPRLGDWEAVRENKRVFYQGTHDENNSTLVVTFSASPRRLFSISLSPTLLRHFLPSFLSFLSPSPSFRS